MIGINVFLTSERDFPFPCIVDVLQEDLDRAHEEIGTLRSLLESEKQSKVDLRKTWEMANLQFIELQQQYKVEVHQLRQQLESDGR